jgi:hypothetical protein
MALRSSQSRHSELLLVSQNSIYMLGWMAVGVHSVLCLRGRGWFLVFFWGVLLRLSLRVSSYC